MAYSPPNISIKIKNLPQIRAAFKMSPYWMAKHLQYATTQAVYRVKARSMADTPVDTGRLVRSHYHKFFKYSALDFSGEVGTGFPKDQKAYYDVYVHEGTKYMRKRPYLKEAVVSLEDEVQGMYVDAVKRTLGMIGRAT